MSTNSISQYPYFTDWYPNILISVTNIHSYIYRQTGMSISWLGSISKIPSNKPSVLVIGAIMLFKIVCFEPGNDCKIGDLPVTEFTHCNMPCHLVLVCITLPHHSCTRMTRWCSHIADHSHHYDTDTHLCNVLRILTVTCPAIWC